LLRASIPIIIAASTSLARLLDPEHEAEA